MYRILIIISFLLCFTQVHGQLTPFMPVFHGTAPDVTPIVLIDSVNQGPSSANASTVTTQSRPKNMVGAQAITVEIPSYRLLGTYGDMVIDNLNNLYVRDTFIAVGSDQPRGTLWRCSNPITSSSMFWTFTSPSASLPSISVQGWSGVTSKNRVAGNLAGGTTTSLFTNPITPSSNGCLVIAFGTGVGGPGLPTVSGSGWNLLYSQTFVSSTRLQYGVWYQIQSTAASISTVVTFGSGNNNPVTIIEALR